MVQFVIAATLGLRLLGATKPRLAPCPAGPVRSLSSVLAGLALESELGLGVGKAY